MWSVMKWWTRATSDGGWSKWSVLLYRCASQGRVTKYLFQLLFPSFSGYIWTNCFDAVISCYIREHTRVLWCRKCVLQVCRYNSTNWTRKRRRFLLQFPQGLLGLFILRQYNERLLPQVAFACEFIQEGNCKPVWACWATRRNTSPKSTFLALILVITICCSLNTARYITCTDC